MLRRMMGAARLDVATFEEVEADSRATLQAMAVVVLVSLAAGLGALGAGGEVGNLVAGVILGLLSWAAWALITFLLGTTLFRTAATQASWAQLARTTGFAQTPGLLRVFGFIPALGLAVIFIATVWQLVAMIIAVRQALDYESTWRALGVVAVGFAIVIVLQVVYVFLI